MPGAPISYDPPPVLDGPVAKRLPAQNGSVIPVLSPWIEFATDQGCHRRMHPIDQLPQLRAGLTTLTHGLPAARRVILSAIVCLRRSIVPVVQPDMCGVITTFGNSWNGNCEGRMLG